MGENRSIRRKPATLGRALTDSSRKCLFFAAKTTISDPAKGACNDDCTTEAPDSSISSVKCSPKRSNKPFNVQCYCLQERTSRGSQSKSIKVYGFLRAIEAKFKYQYNQTSALLQDLNPSHKVWKAHAQTTVRWKTCLEACLTFSVCLPSCTILLGLQYY